MGLLEEKDLPQVQVGGGEGGKEDPCTEGNRKSGEDELPLVLFGLPILLPSEAQMPPRPAASQPDADESSGTDTDTEGELIRQVVHRVRPTRGGPSCLHCLLLLLLRHWYSNC